MFIYEGTKETTSNGEVEVLNICMQATQIPSDTPDVQIWRDGNTVYAKVGTETISGTIA